MMVDKFLACARKRL